MSTEHLTRDALTDRVIDRIQEMIWNGEVTPGDLLAPQTELAQRFGVGLSTIREAIKALSHVGMVKVIPGKGTTVLPDAVSILQSERAFRSNLTNVRPEIFFEARGVIETALAALAAQRSNPADIDHLQKIIDEMENARRDNDIDRFSAADMHFHLVIANISKNEVLEKMYFLVQNIVSEMINNYNQKPGGMERALSYHREILKGITEHDTLRTQKASDPRKYIRQSNGEERNTI